MHRRHLLNLILASAAFALPFGVSATQIRNARLWRSNDKLRSVFDLSGPVQLASFLLPPQDGQDHRLVLDLKTAAPLQMVAWQQEQKKPQA